MAAMVTVGCSNPSADRDEQFEQLEARNGILDLRGATNWNDADGATFAAPSYPMVVGALYPARDAEVTAASAGAVVQLAPVEPLGDPVPLTEEELRTILSAAGWPDGLLAAALRVAWCESRWNPGAIGDNGVSLGLFQIGAVRPGWNGWWLYFGLDESEWADPVANSALAWRIYQYADERYGDGFGPWTCKPH